MFLSAQAGNEKHQLILSRYDSMVKAKRDKERIKQYIRTELVRPHPLKCQVSYKTGECMTRSGGRLSLLSLLSLLSYFGLY